MPVVRKIKRDSDSAPAYSLSLEPNQIYSTSYLISLLPVRRTVISTCAAARAHSQYKLKRLGIPAGTPASFPSAASRSSSQGCRSAFVVTGSLPPGSGAR